MVGTVTGVEHPPPRVNGTADRFRRVGARIVLPAGGPAVRGPVSPVTGSGVPAAGPLIIPLRIGEARPVAGVIHSLLMRSPFGSGFSLPYEISYRRLKLPRVSAPLVCLICGVGPICRRWAVYPLDAGPLLMPVLLTVATIFVIWAISGDVGPADAALHLKPDLAGWQRGPCGVWAGVFDLPGETEWCQMENRRPRAYNLHSYGRAFPEGEP
jgi:hypothetical protein